jgi:hypothetical protein
MGEWGGQEGGGGFRGELLGLGKLGGGVLEGLWVGWMAGMGYMCGWGCDGYIFLCYFFIFCFIIYYYYY